jgi:hypothetical protein
VRPDWRNVTLLQSGGEAHLLRAPPPPARVSRAGLRRGCGVLAEHPPCAQTPKPLQRQPETDPTPRNTTQKVWGAHTRWTPQNKQFDVGGVLLSHTLTSAVPSALEGLATGFGMGPGVPPPPKPPTTQRKSIQLSPTTQHHPPPHPPPTREQVNVVVCSGSHSGCEQQKVYGQALGLLVPVNSTPHRASIPGLSTPSSLGGLNLTRRRETSSWNELPA